MRFHLFCLFSFSLNVLKSFAKGSLKKPPLTDKIFSDIRCSDLSVLLRKKKPLGAWGISGHRVGAPRAAEVPCAAEPRGVIMLHGFITPLTSRDPCIFFFSLYSCGAFGHHQPQATRPVQLGPPQAAMGRFLQLAKTYTLFPLPM